MIHADIKDSAAYELLGSRFRAAFAFLRSRDLLSLPLGSYPIEGDDVYAMVQENLTKPATACRWESHRTYADVQYVVSGCEWMGVAPLGRYTVDVPYDDQKDVIFFTQGEYQGTVLRVEAGEFAVFLPTDVHRPLMAAGTAALVKKVVVKVRV